MAITFLERIIFWWDFFKKYLRCAKRTNLTISRTFWPSAVRYSPKQLSSKKIYFTEYPEEIYNSVIPNWYFCVQFIFGLCDWISVSTWSKNFISERFHPLQTLFSNLSSQILTSLKFSILLDHCFGIYLTAEGPNVLEIARFVRFRECRYF